MINFFKMAGNYNQRKVANTQVEQHVIDTALVTDGKQPYETGVQSPLYNNGKWIIVEAYPDKTQAAAGHARWVEIMRNPPDTIADCRNCLIADMAQCGPYQRKES